MQADEFLDKYEGVINKLSVKYSLNPEVIRDILEKYLIDVKDHLYDPRMPKIRVPNFGSFSPDIKSIKSSIKMTLSTYKRGLTSKERALKVINMLWPVYRRLSIEKDNNQPVRTHPFWHKINPMNYPESFKARFKEVVGEKGRMYDYISKSRLTKNQRKVLDEKGVFREEDK